jgi:CRP/FNR family transcriptional regulator
MPALPADATLRSSLHEHPYFAGLPQDRLEALAALAVRRGFAAGELLFLEGDPCAGLWIVAAGRVKIYKISVEGREHILHMVGPGQSFNDIAALDGGENPASAAALSEGLAWVIASADLLAFLRSEIDLALGVIAGLSERVRALIQQIEDLALYAVPARLARFLLAQLETPALDGPGVTRAAIAAYLATTPESVSRTLRMLEEAGAIRFDRHRIVIVNEDLLRAIAQL